MSTDEHILSLRICRSSAYEKELSLTDTFECKNTILFKTLIKTFKAFGVVQNCNYH